MQKKDLEIDQTLDVKRNLMQRNGLDINQALEIKKKNIMEINQILETDEVTNHMKLNAPSEIKEIPIGHQMMIVLKIGMKVNTKTGVLILEKEEIIDQALKVIIKKTGTAMTPVRGINDQTLEGN